MQWLKFVVRGTPKNCFYLSTFFKFFSIFTLVSYRKISLCLYKKLYFSKIVIFGIILILDLEDFFRDVWSGSSNTKSAHTTMEHENIVSNIHKKSFCIYINI